MSVVTAGKRDRLNAARERVRNARAEVKRAREGVDAARKLGDNDAAATCEVRLMQAQDEQDIATELERALLHQAAGVEHYGRESFLDNPDTVRMLEQLANSGQPVGTVMLGSYMDAEQFASSIGADSFRTRALAAAGPITVPPDQRMQAPYGVVRQLYRPTRLLDVIPTSTMEGLSFVFVREAGSLDTGAQETVEGALKPEELGLDLSQEGTVVAVTIAAWKKVRRQALDDLAGLAVTIQTRLQYLIERRIEGQILNGDGTGANMTGVLHTTGIGSIPFAAGTPLADLVLQGLTTVRLSNAEPNATLLNPTTYEQMLVAKATGSGERLDGGGAFVSPGDTLWGVPVIQSAVVPPNLAVCADWGRATTLYIREGLNLRTSDSDQDDFLRNQVTLLAESRCGLAVWQPSAVCTVALA